MANLKECGDLTNVVRINQLQLQLHSSLLAVLGYALLCGEVNVPVRSEHVTTVPGDTLVVGVSVEVMSA